MKMYEIHRDTRFAVSQFKCVNNNNERFVNVTKALDVVRGSVTKRCMLCAITKTCLDSAGSNIMIFKT